MPTEVAAPGRPCAFRDESPAKARLACERLSIDALACRTKAQADGREWWVRKCEDELLPHRTVPVPDSRLVAPLGFHGASTNRPKDLNSWLLCVSNNARAVRGVR